jgi:hypothetical protein
MICTGSRRIMAVLSVSMLASLTAWGQTNEPFWKKPPVNWFTPSVHLNVAVGDSSAKHPEQLAVGHHDPTREDGTVQGLELGLSLRAGEYLEGFATYTLSYGAEEEWDYGWEEAFLKLKQLPGNFAIRGGRMLSHYGYHNNLHLHAWDFVDMPLVLGRFLGDDGLIIDGGDITWHYERDVWTFLVIGGYGKAKTHSHDHDAHDEHEEHEEHEDEHASHDEGGFSDHVGLGRLEARFAPTDFNHHIAGVSLASGDNGYNDKNTTVLNLDYSYQWRENGYEPGGRAFRWHTEVLYRWVGFQIVEHHHDEHEEEHHEDEHDDEHDEEHHDEHDDEHEEEHGDHEGEETASSSTEGEWGFYTEGIYSFNAHFDTGLRFGYVEGNDTLGTEERYRLSPAATWYLNSAHNLSARLQYNYDHLENSEEHAIWMQVGFSWGGPEVR